MYPYQNPDLSTEERISDLMSRMTLEEKILQTDQYYSGDFTTQDENGKVTAVDMQRFDALMQHNSVGSVQLRGMTAAQANVVQRYAIENTRLGIPYLFSEEALHGLMTNNATSFPQQIGLAASFEPELGREMGHAIAAESRACGIHETYSPVMDLIRDPRYGRAEESYGEDTYLCAEFARETVFGMQGTDLTAPDAVAAEPKHYVGYGNPVGGLNCAPCTMGRHDVFSDCLPVFEAAFADGKACDAMCSYNSIDSIPVSMDHELLTDVLRGQFGMPGFVRSDLTAILAVKSLVDQLDAAGKLDDTVIVLSADHYPYGLTDEEYSELLGHAVDPVFEIYENTLILWNSQMKKPVEVDKYCSSLDIAPTLSNLFGLEYDSRLMMGTDILADQPGMVIFSNYSFICQDGWYNSVTDEYRRWDGAEPDMSVAAAKLAEVQNRVAYSAVILDYDYYRLLFWDVRPAKAKTG